MLNKDEYAMHCIGMKSCLIKFLIHFFPEQTDKLYPHDNAALMQIMTFRKNAKHKKDNEA